MADLNDLQKEKGKIRMRNLHPDLQKLINGAAQSGLIDMNDLSANLQNRIRNRGGDGSGSGGGYDLSEVLEELGRLNYNKADKVTLQQYFNKTIDKLTLDMLDSTIATKVNNAVNQNDLLQYRPISRDITYQDLDSDLKKKINNAALNGGDGGSGSTISDESVAEIQKRLSQHDTNIAGNTDSIAALNERLNNMSELSALVSLPERVSQNTEKITKVASQLDDFLGTNDPENKELGKIGRTRLTTGVLKQLDEGTDAQGKVIALTARVTEAEGNITSLNAKVNSITDLANDVKKQSDDNKSKIDKAQQDLVDIVNGVDTKINDMNLDAVLAKTANTIEQGKIQKRHLAPDINDSLEKIAEFNTRLDQAMESVKRTVEIPGITGQFSFKGSKGTTTKAILNLVPFYDINDDLDTIENKNGFIGVKSKNSIKLYTFDPNIDHEVTRLITPTEPPAEKQPESEAEAGEENPAIPEGENGEPSAEEQPANEPEPSVETVTVKGTWIEYKTGFADELFNFTFIYDTTFHKLYYVNDGTLVEVDVNRPQIKDIKVEAEGTAEFMQLDAMTHVVNVLVEDNDETSRTYGTYVNSEAFCTLAFTETTLKIFNDTENTLNVRIIYS